MCNDHNSFFGMTWPHLKSLLNNVEMTKTYILNPLAPEFIPKSFPHGQPVFMSPGQLQGAPGLYHPHPRAMGPGGPYQQVGVMFDPLMSCEANRGVLRFRFSFDMNEGPVVR